MVRCYLEWFLFLLTLCVWKASTYTIFSCGCYPSSWLWLCYKLIVPCHVRFLQIIIIASEGGSEHIFCWSRNPRTLSLWQIWSFKKTNNKKPSFVLETACCWRSTFCCYFFLSKCSIEEFWEYNCPGSSMYPEQSLDREDVQYSCIPQWWCAFF